MNYLKILAAIGLFVIGVPGLLDDVVQRKHQKVWGNCGTVRVMA